MKRNQKMCIVYSPSKSKAQTFFRAWLRAPKTFFRAFFPAPILASTRFFRAFFRRPTWPWLYFFQRPVPMAPIGIESYLGEAHCTWMCSSRSSGLILDHCPGHPRRGELAWAPLQGTPWPWRLAEDALHLAANKGRTGFAAQQGAHSFGVLTGHALSLAASRVRTDLGGQQEA